MANTESKSTSMSGPRPFPFRWLRWRLHHVFHGCLLLAIIGVIVYGWQGVLWSIPALLMVPLLADGMARPASNLFYPTITHGARRRPRVALTFDDCPDPHVTQQELDAVAAYGARAPRLEPAIAFVVLLAAVLALGHAGAGLARRAATVGEGAGRRLGEPDRDRAGDVAAAGRGLANGAVARRLYISPHTVNTHLRHVFAKLAVTNRVALAAEVHHSIE